MRLQVPLFSDCPANLWAVLSSLALFILSIHSSCPPGDPRCEPKSINKPVKADGWTNRLLPGLPSPNSGEFGEPISDLEFSKPAGHNCHSLIECDISSNLSCEHFFHTTSTSSPSSVAIRSGSDLLRRRSVSLVESVCSRVHCNTTCPNLTAESIQCPPDSYIVERESDDQTCCIQTCKCLPDKCDKQQKHNCSYGFVITSRADHLKPGKCCDQIKCVDEPSSVDLNKPRQHCQHGGANYSHGQQWTTEDCNTCQCKDGVAVCDKTNNCPLQIGCLVDNITLSPDQCCPLCKGCMYNNQWHPHLSTWMEDQDCQYCTCTDSRVKCHTTMCRPVTCSANQVPTRKEGECCLQCVCNLHCPFGFKKDSSDNDLCECLDEVHSMETVVTNNPLDDHSPCLDGNSRQCDTRSDICAEDDANCKQTKEPRREDSPGLGVGSWVICIAITILFVALFLFFGLRHLCGSRQSQAGSTVQSKYEYHAVNRQEPGLASTLDSSNTKANSSPVGGQGQMANGHGGKPQSDPTATNHSTTLNLKEETSQV